MPDTLQLLVVEDSEQDIKEWQNLLERYSVDESRTFDLIATFAASLPEAVSLLDTRRFDAAVVDLGLKQVDGAQQNNADGKVVVELLALGELATVAIYTGQPNDAKTFDPGPNIKTIEKGGGIDEVLTWLKSEAEITVAIRDASKIIRRDMAATFRRSIWPRWKAWQTNDGIDEQIALSIARHLVSHVYTQLLKKSPTVHPEEHYYLPSLPENDITTGDMILTNSGTVEVIITPRCDVAHQNKTETIQLAECQDESAMWRELHTNSTPAKLEKIKNTKQHGRREVQHFIPAMTIMSGESRGPWLVRFDKIRSVIRNSEEMQILREQRFASISSEFIPSLVQRLGAFFSRIGTPDLH